MSVFQKFEPQGSNKTARIKFTDIAYTKAKHWVVLKPVIDKISFTYDIPPDERDAVKGLLLDVIKDPETPQFENAKLGNKRYKVNARLAHPATGKPVLIQADPKPAKGKNPSFLRFEFNPRKLGADGVGYFKEQIKQFLLDQYPWSEIAVNCTVTRLDLAVDIVNVAVDELLIEGPGNGKARAYYSAPGTLETLYLGIKGGKKSGTKLIYNKAQQLADKKRATKFGGLAHTRIEVRAETKLPIAALAKLKNPFLTLSIANPELVPCPAGDDYVWKLFLDSVRFRGRKAALAHLPDELAAAFAGAMGQSSAFWQPAKIWSKWPAVLNESGLLG